MFTVVIPTYNHARYLHETVRSCLSDPAVTEILIADDGSHDKSHAIAKTFSQWFPSKVRDISTEPPVNIGAHRRLNGLIQKATNDWIAVLNSDDAFGVSRFQILRQWLRTTKADLIFGSLSIFDPLSNRIGAKTPTVGAEYPFPPEVDVGVAMAKQDWLPVLLNQNVIATTSNMVFTKELHRRIGGFQDYRYVHDWDFALRACMMGRVAYCAQMLTSYRIHPGNTIAEDSVATVAETRQLFNALFRDFAETPWPIIMQSDRAMVAALAGNRYLRNFDGNLLAIVAPHKDAIAVIESRLKLPAVRVYEAFEDVPGDTRYVYAPASEQGVLSVNILRNILLCLGVASYDFILVSQSLADLPDIGVEVLANSLVARRDIVIELNQGIYTGPPLHGRLMRHPAERSETRSIYDFIPGPILMQRGELFLGNFVDTGSAHVPCHVSVSPGILGPREITKPVVFILPSLIAIGGVERILVELTGALKDRYSFVTICTERLAASQGSWLERLLAHCDGCFLLPEILPRDAYFMALRFLKHTYGPALVWICNGSSWQVEHALALRKLFKGIPVVDHQVYDSKHGWIEWFDHPGVQASDCFVAVTKQIERELVVRYGLPSEKLRLIYHPISESRIAQARVELDRHMLRLKYRVPENGVVLAFVGRLSPQKQPMRFLELCKQAKERHNEACFLLVGGGELEEECQVYIEKYQLLNVRKLGFVQDIFEIYSLIDGMVITSSYEGVPVAMLEAMAMGVPIFATDVGDIRIILSEYGTGTVVDEAWPVSSVYGAFFSWLDDIEEHKRTAAGICRDIVQRFSIDAVSSQYDEMFRALLVAERKE